MLFALRQISLRHFAAHKLRTLLTAAGVAWGVAAAIGLWLVTDSASRSYQQTIDGIAGKAQLEITNGQLGLPEELLDEVKAVSGVQAAVPSVQGFLGLAPTALKPPWGHSTETPAFVPTPGLAGERLYVMGIDMLADRAVRDYQFSSSAAEASFGDPLIFLAQPDSVGLTTEFLKTYGLKQADKLRVHSVSGPAMLTIRAMLDIRKGPASLFGGRLALMDIFAAERIFGLNHRFTQLDIVAKPGVDLAALETALVRIVGGRGTVERSAARGRNMERILAGQRSAFTFGAVTGVVVGIYLVFNTMMIAVAQRRREIGILRATGLRRREVMTLIAMEALALGVLGCVAGVPLGIGFARAILPLFAAFVSGAYFPVGGVKLAVEPGQILLAVGLGLLSALVAALVPAREAVSAQPVEAMRRLAGQDSPRSYWRAALAGVAFMALSIVMWVAGKQTSAGAAAVWSAQAAFLLGLSLIAPTLVRSLAVRVERRLSFTSAPLCALAGRSIVSNVRRVAISSAALVIGLASAVSTATILSSVRADLSYQIYLGFGAVDLLVASTAGAFNPGDSKNLLPLPESVAHEIAAVPGVAQVTAERWVQVPYQGFPMELVATDGGLRKGYMREGRLGDPARGEITVGEQIARRYHKGLGEVVSFKTPAGEIRLRIAGVGFDSSIAGWIGIDRSAYKRLWGDDTINQILVALKPGANLEQVSNQIRSRFGERYGVSAFSVSDFRHEAEIGLMTAYGAAYPMIVFTICISLLGVVISLIATVLDGTRDFEVLRATVATRRQVVGIVMLEATTIGLAGAILGVAGGSIGGYTWVRGVFPNLFGHTPVYSYPAGAALFAFIAGIALAAAAGYLPGRSASRLKIVEALAYE